MDYLKAVSNKGLEVRLAERVFQVYPLSLRLFFLLQQTIASTTEDERVVSVLSLLLGVPQAFIEESDALEAYSVYEQLVAFAAPQPIHLDFTQPSKSVPSNYYAYEHRGLAHIVSTLAKAYGWTRDYILDSVTYDEARCYLQELALDEYEDREYLYSLSQVAYDEKGHYRKLPPPLIPPLMPNQTPHPRVIRPHLIVREGQATPVAGVVISLDELMQRSKGRE